MVIEENWISIRIKRIKQLTSFHKTNNWRFIVDGIIREPFHGTLIFDINGES